MSASSLYSARTKCIVKYALKEAEDKVVRLEINALPLCPTVKYETSPYFLDNDKNQEEKGNNYRKVKRWLLNYNSDQESTCDDSDKDHTYSPSSSNISSNDEDTQYPAKEKKKRKLELKKKEDRKLKKSENAYVNDEDTLQTNCSSQKKDLSHQKEEDNSREATNTNKNNEEKNQSHKKEHKNIQKNGGNNKQNPASENIKQFNQKEEDKNKEATIVTYRNNEQETQINEQKEEHTHQEENIQNNGVNNQKKPAKLSSLAKIERDKKKHPMRKRCNEKCRRQCNFITEDVRKSLWNNFWSMDYTPRRKWLAKHVTLVPVKRKTVDSQKNRNESRLFTLPLPNGTEQNVCRFMFLNTLGYTNDSVITHLVASIKGSPCGSLVKERRGIHPKPHFQIERAPIENHINLFHPCISHYRRKNAPNIKYLPRELTCKYMYDDFKTKNENNKCSIEIYRQTLKEMNISFHMPKSDKCETCVTLENKIKDFKDSNADVIAELEKHKEKAKRAEQEYKKDSEESARNNPGIRYFSMDLQKVIIVPIMPQCKTSFFTSRLIVFNETFATINKDAKNSSYCVVWHEAIGNRKAEAIVDAILSVITKERDINEFIFWADNCTGQNKNYVLYSTLVATVNSLTGPNKITLRYLTKGHTHMSADSIHGNIEQKILKKRNVYDYEDLINTIEQCRKNLSVLRLETFHLFLNKKRSARKGEDLLKNFVLNNVVEASFEKGCYNVKIKCDFTEDPKEVDLFQKKYISQVIAANCPAPIVLPERGISSSKKAKILKDLVPLMPLNRRIFWQNLPESDSSVDLTNNEQYPVQNDDE